MKTFDDQDLRIDLDLGIDSGIALDDLDVSLDGDRSPIEQVKYVDDVEKDTRAELDAVQAAFRDRREKEKQRYELATDSEFWFCVCFQTREQKEKFLSAIGLDRDVKYIDGLKYAKKIGVSLDRVTLPGVKHKRDAALAPHVRKDK